MKSTLFLYFALTLSAIAQEKSIHDLNMLIGKWKTEDVYMKGTSAELTDKGERTCRYMLNDTYINCETIAVNSRGVARKYQFLINYNKITGQYEMISIYSNWPMKRIDIISIHEGGKVLEMVGKPDVENNIEKRIWGTLSFSDADHYTWQGKRNTSLQKPDEWTDLFTETGERISTSKD
jgi:hypothetical protein